MSQAIKREVPPNGVKNTKNLGLNGNKSLSAKI